MPSEEVIIVPMDMIYQSCDDGIHRMESLVNASIRDYLPYVLKRTSSYDEAAWHARRLFRDFGRVTRENNSVTIGRIIDAIGTFQRELYYLIARHHGISYQTIEVLRFIGTSAVVLRLIPTRITISPSQSDDYLEDP